VVEAADIERYFPIQSQTSEADRAFLFRQHGPIQSEPDILALALRHLLRAIAPHKPSAIPKGHAP
jgi:hypothetical protein